MPQLSALTCTVLSAVTLGCMPPKEPPPEAPAPAPAEQVAPTPKKPAPPTEYEIPAEQKRDMYMGCWSFFNSKKLEKIVGCYHEDASFEVAGSGCPVMKGPGPYLQRLSDFLLAVPDATGKLQLVLTHENMVVGVALIRGTHTGPLKTPEGEIPATNKKIGFLFGHVVEFEKNKIARDVWFRDPNTMLAQIGKSTLKGRKAISESAEEKPTPISQGKNQEKMNVGLFNNYFAAFNTHDLERVEPMLADDYVYANQYVAKDYEGKDQAMKYHEAMLNAFSDMKFSHENVFAAGDYVVGFSTFTGTHDGPLRSWNQWKGTDKSVSLEGIDILQVAEGKVKKHMVFANGRSFAEQLGIVDAPPPGSSCPEPPKAADAEAGEKVDVDMDADGEAAPADAKPADAAPAEAAPAKK